MGQKKSTEKHADNMHECFDFIRHMYAHVYKALDVFTGLGSIDFAQL